MIINKFQARELGEAMIDAADAVEVRKKDQQVIFLDGKAVAVPYDHDPESYNSSEAYELAGVIVKY